MRALFLLFIFLSSVWSLEINEYKSDIYYGNGIMTLKKEAEKTLLTIIVPTIEKEIYNGNSEKMNTFHNFNVAYNYSASEIFGNTPQAMILDLMESYEQMTETSLGWKVFDLFSNIIIPDINIISKWPKKRIKDFLVKEG